MPKALTLKQAWIRALESGEYKQTQMAWTKRNEDQTITIGFCCLSVLYAVQHGEKPGCGHLHTSSIKDNAAKLLGEKVTWDLVNKNDHANWTFPMIANYLKRNTKILRGVLLDIKA